VNQPSPNGDQSAWVSKSDALKLLAVSERSLDRLVTAGKVEKQTRPRANRVPEPVYNRADIERITAVEPFPVGAAGSQALERSGDASLPQQVERLLQIARAVAVLPTPAQNPAPSSPRHWGWLTLDEASERCGLSAKLLASLIRKRLLPALKDEKVWKIHALDLDGIRSVASEQSARRATRAPGGAIDGEWPMAQSAESGQ